jgi:hypothetical protein
MPGEFLAVTSTSRLQQYGGGKILQQTIENLNLTLNQHIFSETGATLYKTNPLTGTPDCVMSAKIQEYFSLEMGFLKLDSGDHGVVLFHLNQVWTEGLNAAP